MPVEHIEFLVEETSMEAALRVLIPRILPGRSFDVHPHEGKPDLIGKLEARLRGYRRWLPNHFGVVVIVDEDREDCRRLKARLEDTAGAAGFRTRSRRAGRPFQLINWLAIEELEAWFLGDVQALTAAYPGVPPTLAIRRGFRDCDAIAGGTWETLERLLKRAGHHLGGLNKMEAARAIAQRMDPSRNRSRSFQGFRRALQQWS